MNLIYYFFLLAGLEMPPELSGSLSCACDATAAERAYTRVSADNAALRFMLRRTRPKGTPWAARRPAPPCGETP